VAEVAEASLPPRRRPSVSRTEVTWTRAEQPPQLQSWLDGRGVETTPGFAVVVETADGGDGGTHSPSCGRRLPYPARDRTPTAAGRAAAGTLRCRRKRIRTAER